MKAGIRTTLALGLSALVIGGGTAAAGADTDEATKVTSKASCSLTLAQARSTFATYLQPPIKTRGVSCGKALKVIKAFHECRKDNGGKDGRCKSRVDGYKCDEGKRTGVPGVRYEANVVCKKGSKKIKHLYQMSL